MADFAIITGLSGAGRSVAAKHLEDLGWFVIDNLPPTLMPKVAELAAVPGTKYSNVALVVGGNSDHEQIAGAITELRAEPDVTVRTVFLHARVPVLVRRYEATRHRHPFEGVGSVADAIVAEAAAMEPVRGLADMVIDTSDLNVHDLGRRLGDGFAISDEVRRMSTRVVSFGFKHGIPLDVDMVLDCRFLPNPHWVEDLRPLTGRDEPVKDYVLGQPMAEVFLEHIRSLLADLMPAYEAEGKSYLSIALGCTGGHHRSVAIAEEVQQMLGSLGYDAAMTHRDIDT